MTFKLDYEGLGELLRGPEMEVAMVAHLEPIKERAEAHAPVDTKGPHPGRYKAAFEIESGVRPDRAYGRLVNTAPEAILVEYGSKNNPRHRTLGRALGIAGDVTP